MGYRYTDRHEGCGCPDCELIATLAHVGEQIENLNENVVGILEVLSGSSEKALPMILHCPKCHAQHVDEGEWATKPHRTHLCERCNHEWRPANTHTIGVKKL